MEDAVLSHVWLCATSWTIAHQAPLSVGFSRQEYWNGLPCPPPGDLPNPGVKSAFSAAAGGFFTTSITWEAQVRHGAMENFSWEVTSHLRTENHRKWACEGWGEKQIRQGEWKYQGPGAKDHLSSSRNENETMVMNLRFILSAVQGVMQESGMISFTCLKDYSGCFMING